MAGEGGKEAIESARYELRRLIGSGSYGDVYEAFDCDRGIPVAVKVLRRAEASSIYRFKREFRALTGIVHPNLVKLYDLVNEDESWFLSMELVAGRDFISYLGHGSSISGAPTLKTPPTRVDGDARGGVPRPSETPAPKEARLDEARTRSALLQLAEGVMALHRADKLHRDIKPSNVLVTPEGRVVLVDFGLVSELETTARDERERPLGTVTYMAPEQADGDGSAVWEAADWYAVGVMMFVILTGRLPFEGSALDIVVGKRSSPPPHPCSNAIGIPRELGDLCHRLLATAPSDRPTGEEVLRQLGGASPRDDVFTPIVPSSAPRFLGREAELGSLMAALEATRSGQPTLVHLEGRSGIGKSALLKQFVRDLSRHDHALVLSGRCQEREAVPFKALDGVVDTLSRALCGMDRAAVRALMPEESWPLACLFPVLDRGDLIASAPTPPVDDLDRSELRKRAVIALRQLMMRITEHQPLALCIDDAQWGDLDSATLLIDLLKPPSPPALLLVLSCRSEELASSPMLTVLADRAASIPDVDVRHLAVGPLDERDSRTLARELLGDGETSSLARTIVRDAEGIPFFIVEMSHYAQLMQTDELDAFGRDLTVERVVSSHVGRLPESARRVLEVISIGSGPLSARVTLSAAQHLAQPHEVDDQHTTQRIKHVTAITDLQAMSLIKGTAKGKLETYHDRIREVVAGGLSAPHKTHLHGALARALEVSGDANPETLHIHWYGAGERQKAGTYAARAAQQALDSLAFERAAALYRRALELVAPPPGQSAVWLENLGNALAGTGETTQAADVYRQAALEANELKAYELRKLSAVYLMLSDRIVEGKDALRSLLADLGIRLPRSLAGAFLFALIAQARIRLLGVERRLRGARALDSLERLRIETLIEAGFSVADLDVTSAMAISAEFQVRILRTRDPGLMAFAHIAELGMVASRGAANMQRCRELWASAEILAPSMDPKLRGLMLISLAASYMMLGKYDVARQRAEQSVEVFRSGLAGPTAFVYLQKSRWQLIHCLIMLGELAEASRILPEMLEGMDKMSNTFMAAVHRVVGYATRLAEDNVERALQETDAALDTFESAFTARSFPTQLQFFCLTAAVYSNIYAEDVDAMWRQLNERWPKVSRSSTFRLVQFFRVLSIPVHAAGVLARAEHRRRHGSEFNALLEAASRDVERLRMERSRFADAFSHLSRAGIEALRGHNVPAARNLQHAEMIFSGLDLKLYSAAARRHLGRILGGNEGADLVASADSFMRAQQIVNPARMAATMAPGFGLQDAG